jgi:hypothetical protein
VHHATDLLEALEEMIEKKALKLAKKRSSGEFLIEQH